MGIGEIITIVILLLPILGIFILCYVNKMKKLFLFSIIMIILLGCYYLKIDEFNIKVTYTNLFVFHSNIQMDQEEEEELVSIINDMTFKKQNVLSGYLKKIHTEPKDYENCYITVHTEDNSMGDLEICLATEHSHNAYLFQMLFHEDSENIHCILEINDKVYYSDNDQLLRDFLLEL